MFSNLGFTEIAVIAVVALLIFGPKKLPELMQTFGKGMREFQKAVREVESEIKDSVNAEVSKEQKENKDKPQT